MVGETILHYKIIQKLSEGGLDRRSRHINLEITNDW
jgi:hypothetical protein